MKIGQKLVCVDNSRMAEWPTITYGSNAGDRQSYNSRCFRPVDETFGEEVAEKLEKEFISQPEPALV